MEGTTKGEPHWKLVQRVVALLEKSLTPDAEVLHDQRLPDITTGHLRQCDVVVRYGKAPRQLTAMVEVQDRASKVEIATLEGWWQKKEAVGAQLLICVSALDYPQSVKDQVAKKLGPSVRLLRLRELESSEWPGWELVFRLPEATTDANKPYGVLYGPGPLGPGSKVQVSEMTIYIEGREQPVSVGELIVAHFDRLGPMPLEPGIYPMDININVGSRLWAEHAGIRQEIRKLQISTIVTMHQVTLPMAMASYEQVDVDGTIAWVATAEGNVGGKQVHFRTTFVPNADGRFVLSRVEATGAERGGYLAIAPELLPNVGI